jgi:hypothetical protein
MQGLPDRDEEWIDGGNAKSSGHKYPSPSSPSISALLLGTSVSRAAYIAGTLVRRYARHGKTRQARLGWLPAPPCALFLSLPVYHESAVCCRSLSLVLCPCHGASPYPSASLPWRRRFSISAIYASRTDETDQTSTRVIVPDPLPSINKHNHNPAFWIFCPYHHHRNGGACCLLVHTTCRHRPNCACGPSRPPPSAAAHGVQMHQ